ncbi:MAG: hydrogenase formation protein HypD [Helicobacteraceae bacterium]|jgi:hydrogenase expression/formation protein HypD|nr:hydrogenase formation protein HypD [Helicobacteraceae bacterium]
MRDYINEYRDPALIGAIASQIARENKRLCESGERQINIMEICGGHTHTIMKYGISQLLPANIRFIHGPGCPVCVMPKERIDHAITLAEMPDTILATLGDMIRVPGSKKTLQEARSAGADIRALYTPLDLIKIARENPRKKVIFFAIGFETTTPMTAILLEKTIALGLKNLFFHINHILVPPPVRAIMLDGGEIDAFLGPSHVSVITGYQIFAPIATEFKTPITVSGFEPSDVLQGVLMILRQFNEGRREVENQYSRAVSAKGNEKAQELIAKYMLSRESFRWRGLGDIKKSALKLRENYAEFDAEVVFKEFLSYEPIDDHKLCLCAEILKGKKSPLDCKVFGKACAPRSPLGSCMVSGEGACAAYYKYGLK